MVGLSGFVQLRRGLSEHVRDGRLSFFEASLYVFILMDTNPATGLCYGSAGLFAAIYGLSNRTCRDALEKLEIKGYLKRFPTRGRHGSYPILINKFRCSDGAMKGKHVSCPKSTSLTNIYYSDCDDDVNDSAVAGVNEDVNESVNDGAASKRLETRDLRLETPRELTLSSPGEQFQSKIRLQDFPESWNRLCGALPKVETFSDSRKKQVSARIKQGITLARFKEAIRCCTEKPFLRGDGEKGWTADFDWLVKNDKNIEKAITQPYGTSKKGSGGNNAAVFTGKTDGNMGLCEELIAEDQYRSRPCENGVMQASPTKQDGPATLLFDSRTTRHESLPSSDGDDF